MAWIESHQDLGSNPKTRRAAHLLDVSIPQVVGHLQFLWWWALDHALDGDLTEFDSFDLADAARWEGDPDEFVDALLSCGPGGKCGFLERMDDGSLVLHDWMEFTEGLQAAKVSGQKGNHVKWHVKRGIVNPDCDYCDGDGGEDVSPGQRQPDQPEDVAPDSHPSRTRVAGDSPPDRDPTPPDLTEPNPPDQTKVKPTSRPDSPPDGDDDPDTPNILHDDPDLVHTLTRQLAVGIKANGHSIPKPDSTARDSWLVEMDRLLRLGPKGGEDNPPDPDEVADVIDFAVNDDFWRAPIQSAGKFREKYTQLRLQMQRTGSSNGRSPPVRRLPEPETCEGCDQRLDNHDPEVHDIVTSEKQSA